jgi:hypothetical protein
MWKNIMTYFTILHCLFNLFTATFHIGGHTTLLLVWKYWAKALKVLSRQYITPGQCSTWEPLARGSVAGPLRSALNSCGNQYRIMLTVSGLAARLLFLYFGRYQLYHQYDNSQIYFTYLFRFSVKFSFELLRCMVCFTDCVIA